MTVPVGYKLCEEGEEIKSGYLIFSDLRWRKANQGEIGKKWSDDWYIPMANLIANPVVKSEGDNLKNIVKATLKLYSIDILRKFVPDYELQDLNKQTGLDLDTLVKIRDIVQGG